MQSKLSTALAVLALIGLADMASHSARAHEGDNGPHGGQVVEVKGHHVEFTTKGGEITVYLSDEAEAAIPSKGATGRAVILEGAKQSTVPLTPAEPNLLTAKLEAALAAGARVVVSAKLADGHDILARFVVK